MQGILNHRPVLFLAENDANGGVLVLQPHLAVEGCKIELHLADEFGHEFTDLEFDGHQRLQPAVE